MWQLLEQGFDADRETLHLHDTSSVIRSFSRVPLLQSLGPWERRTLAEVCVFVSHGLNQQALKRPCIRRHLQGARIPRDVR